MDASLAMKLISAVLYFKSIYWAPIVSGRSPRGGNGNPRKVFLPGKSPRQRSLVGFSPWGGKESDMTELTNCVLSTVLGVIDVKVNDKTSIGMGPTVCGRHRQARRPFRSVEGLITVLSPECYITGYCWWNAGQANVENSPKTEESICPTAHASTSRVQLKEECGQEKQNLTLCWLLGLSRCPRGDAPFQ